MRWPVAGFVTLSLAAACVAPQQQVAQAITLESRTPGGQVVAGVEFWANGLELGRSGADGVLVTQLQARQGESLSIHHICPAGYGHPSPRRRLPLGARDGDSGSIRLHLRVQCSPRRVALPLVVRTGQGAGLPVLVDGEPAITLDQEGVAHLLLTRQPHGRVDVRIDTSSRPSLRPRNPVRSFEVGDRPSILLFDLALTRQRPPRRRGGTPRRQDSARPYRIR